MTAIKLPKPIRRTGDGSTYRSSDWRPLVRQHDPEGLLEFEVILAQVRRDGRLTRANEERLFELAGLRNHRVRGIVLRELRGYRKLARFAAQAARLSWPKVAPAALAAWDAAAAGTKPQAVRDAVYDVVAPRKLVTPSP